jgi:hypothetical protein
MGITKLEPYQSWACYSLIADLRELEADCRQLFDFTLKTPS